MAVSLYPKLETIFIHLIQKTRMRKRKLYSILMAAALLLPGVGAKAQSWTDPDTNVEYAFVEGNVDGNEGSAMIIDGNVETKLGTGGLPTYFVVEASEAVSIIGYTIITANDNSSYPGRNPNHWTIEGSNDYENWTFIDEVMNDETLQDVNFTPFEFTCPASEKFKYFRVTILSVVGGGFMQVSEWHFHGVSHEHVWGEPVETLPTCRKDGYFTYTCEICGAMKNEPSGKEATGIHEYENGYCINCGKAENEPLVEDGFWILETPQDLVYFADRVVADDAFDRNARLAADIDVADVNFQGIGVGTQSRYVGEFDGDGHWIINYTREGTRQGSVGLFGMVGAGGYIHNVGLLNANLNGDANVAGLVGRLYGGVIEECAVVNSYIEGRDHVAAITGDVNHESVDGEEVGGIVRNCFSNAVINSREYQASGISGVINGGLIENNLFCGTVDCGYTNASIACSLVDSEGVVSVIQNNALLASHNYGFGDSGNGSRRVTHTYGRYAELANNWSLATTRLILLIGENYYYAYSNSIDNFANDPNDDNGADISDQEAREQDFYSDVLNWDFGGVWGFYPDTEGKAYPVLQWMIESERKMPTQIFDVPADGSKLIYETGDEYIDLNRVHGSFGQKISFAVIEGEGKATYDEGVNQLLVGDNKGEFGGTGNVVVKVSYEEDLSEIFEGAADTTFSVYVDQSGVEVEISDPETLQRAVRNPGGNYKLVKDIDMTGVEFAGIGSSNEPFTGSFDGNGHIIKGLTITADGGSRLGFFNYTNGATIKNLAISNITIDAPKTNQVGGLIGECVSTTLDQIALSGFITGWDHVGGLIGRTSGKSVINNCYDDVRVYAYSQAGGISGTTNRGDSIVFENTYFAGSVYIYHRGWAGGFIGLIDQDNTNIYMTGCVSVGDVISHTDGNADGNIASPFIGANGASLNLDYQIGKARVTFNNNVRNVDAIIDGLNNEYAWPAIGSTEDEYTAAAELPADDMKKKATYENLGWDFNRTWEMDKTAYGYPILSIFGGFNTRIATPEADVAPVQNGAIYNLQGQRVAEGYKGIVIMNGKKVLVK